MNRPVLSGFYILSVHVYISHRLMDTRYFQYYAAAYNAI